MTSCALTRCNVVICRQAVTVRQGRPVVQVCNRKGTTWYENNAVRFRQSVQSESRVDPGMRSRLEASLKSLTKTAYKWVQALAPLDSKKNIWGKKKSPLWVYVSLSISQTYNKLCAPFENKMREMYFYKEVCFVRSLKFVHHLWLCSWLGLWEIYNAGTYWKGKGPNRKPTHRSFHMDLAKYSY